MPAFLLNAPSAGQQRLYLDESGTLGYGGEIFTMAMVLVRDLPKLEACTLKNRVTQSEVKASQMKTAQKLALARTLLDENDIEIYLVKLDPLAAMVSERKLDKELLYDSMVAQALAFYLERGELAQGLPYRISMDMRGGLRESYEDMVAESVGNVLMHRDNPLVTSLDARFLDSKYSAGVQAADLFSNIYRTALTQTDSPCRSFLHKYQADGLVHAGFTFGLVELADQMTQIAADLRARVELERAKALAASEAPADLLAEPVETEDAPTSQGLSRSARRRRSRAARRDREAAEKTAEAVGADAEVVPAEAIIALGEIAEGTQAVAVVVEPEAEAAGVPDAGGAAVEGVTAPENAAMPIPATSAGEAPGDDAAASPARESPAMATPGPTKRVLPFAPEGRRTRTRRNRTATSATRAEGTIQQPAVIGHEEASNQVVRQATEVEPAREVSAAALGGEVDRPAAESALAGEPPAPAPTVVPQTQAQATSDEQVTPAVDTPAKAVPTVAKIDVRPGRAIRSRQAAQVASRRRRRTRTPEAIAEQTPVAPREQSVPVSPSEGTPDAAAEQAAPKPASHRRRRSAAKSTARETSSAEATSGSDAPVSAPAEEAAPDMAAPAAVTAPAEAPATENAMPAVIESPASPAPDGTQAEQAAPKKTPRKRSSSRRRKGAVETTANDGTPAASNPEPAPTAASEAVPTTSESAPPDAAPATPRKRPGSRRRKASPEDAPSEPTQSPEV